ncbi:reverse transcriptase domain-containing protein [Streptomyces sp. NPDC057717]|uniref:reverse transcriptase domain-containing protein n=1 Tax=Streptomyces sp. NPDC057717 TaxID=3346224 RepID=UPI003675C59F
MMQRSHHKSKYLTQYAVKHASLQRTVHFSLQSQVPIPPRLDGHRCSFRCRSSCSTRAARSGGPPPLGASVQKCAEREPVLVRYADDLASMCTSREQAERFTERLAAWLTPRGLAFHKDKTRIVYAENGFDFLGLNVRGITASSGPSAATRTAEALDTRQLIRAGSTRPGRTGEGSVTASAAPTYPSSPGRRSSGTS